MGVPDIHRVEYKIKNVQGILLSRLRSDTNNNTKGSMDAREFHSGVPNWG